MSRDIYCLEKYKKGITCCILNNKRSSFKEDDSNIIYTKGNKMESKKNGEFNCQVCRKNTLFLHRFLDGNQVCPPCAIKMNPSRQCGDCNQKQWCDSCGGRSNIMLFLKTKNHGEVVLCDQDKCLMPFGFCSNSVDRMTCTCRYHILRKLYGKLPDDLVPIVKEYAAESPSDWGVCTISGDITLSDLTVASKNYCLPCQIKAKYSSPSLATYYDNLCLCYMKTESSSDEESDF